MPQWLDTNFAIDQDVDSSLGKSRSGLTCRQLAALGLAATTCLTAFNSSAGLAQYAWLAAIIGFFLILWCILAWSNLKQHVTRAFTANTCRVLAVTNLVALDVMFCTFCLPFLPDLFNSWGKSNSQMAFLASAYSYSSLFAGTSLLVFQGIHGKELDDFDSWRVLASAASFMTVISFVQAAFPTYLVFWTTRCLQGLISQICWSYGLALGMRLPSLLGASCVAWISSGESIGELAGPWFGSVLYQLGGVRGPFAVASVMMSLNTCLLSTMALTRHAQTSQLAQDASEAQAKGDESSSALGFSVLKLPRVARLCTLLILACAMARGALDVLAPIHLKEVFDVSPGGIGKIFGFGTICYLFGSMLGGRRLPSSVPLRIRAWAMCAAHMCMSISMVLVFRTGSSHTLASCLGTYLATSALVNVSVNTQLEEIGADHGVTESVSTLCVLSWSIGFALGGVVTQIGAQSTTSRLVAMTCIGVANVIWLLWNAFVDRNLLCGKARVSDSGQRHEIFSGGSPKSGLAGRIQATTLC